MHNPVTLSTPRVRDLCLNSPFRTNRSVDSGYGSLETSPTRSPIKRRSDRASSSLAARIKKLSLNSYDGNTSEESEHEASTDNDAESELNDSPCAGRNKFTTPPRMSRRRISRTDSYPLLPSHQTTHQRYGSDNLGIQGTSINSVKQLDRFVPLRDQVVPGSQKLRTTRPLDDLTPSERLVRHNRDAPDPFCFKRQPIPPSPTESRKARRSGNGTTLDAASHVRTDRVVSHHTHYPHHFLHPHVRLFKKKLNYVTY